MTATKIQPSFAAGEISPSLWGRVDFAKFHVGASTMRNFYVDYRGGASTRPGGQFCGAARQSGPRLIPFVFSVADDQTYVLEFGDFYMRVIANGGYVLETQQEATSASNANPIVIGKTAHGYANGDWIYFSAMQGMENLNGQTYIVTAATANTLSLLDIFGNAVNSTTWGTYTASSGFMARVYTMATPYAASDLPLLKYAQDANVMTLTHPDYQQRDLTRADATDWSLATTTFGAAISAPTSVYVSASVTTGSNPTSYSFVVTAIDGTTGQESIASYPATVTNSVNIGSTAGSIMITWTPVSGASSYNIYQAPPSYSSRIPIGSRFGWIGSTVGTGFINSNIVPDYTTTPPIHANPFARSTITWVDVLNPGSGYHQDTTTASTTGNGSGAALIPIIDATPAAGVGGGGPGATGGCQGIIVVTGGEGYTAGAGTSSTAGYPDTSAGVGGAGSRGFGGGAGGTNATAGSGGGGGGGYAGSQAAGSGAMDTGVYAGYSHGPGGGGGGGGSKYAAPGGAGGTSFGWGGGGGGGAYGYPYGAGGSGANGGIALSYVSTVTGATILQFITTPGASTWTVPADCTSVTVGGYGAGGGANSPYGAGGGAYAASTIAVTPGATVYCSVGSGGAGVATEGDGHAGGDTWLNKAANSAPLVSANGVLAKAGHGATGGGIEGGDGSPGAGGSAAACVGSTAYSGGSGGSGHIGGGGGGGGAGPFGAGKAGGASTGTGWGSGGGGGGGSNGSASSLVTLTDTDPIPGSDATFSVHTGPASGTWPGLCAYFQQRRVYANSRTKPDTYWMSKPGSYTNFDYADPTNDGDSVEGSPWAQQVNGINWMVPMPGGLVILTGKGAWQLSGNGSKGSAVTPSSQNADPQAYYGCSAIIPPISINSDILYTDNNVVYDLVYNFYTQIYTGQDITILATHLLKNRSIKAWAWANKPHKIIWVVLDNGALLSLSFLKDQEIMGWARHDTQGLFQDVCVIPEGGFDRVYFAVERYVGGQWLTYIERLDARQWEGVEDVWAVDCGLRYPMPAPAATLTASASSGAGVTFTASAPIFDPSNAGAVIRMGGGVATVTAYVSPTQLVATITKPIGLTIPDRDDSIPLPATSGEWTLTHPVSTVSGLGHLEGQAVVGLADGVPFAATVSGGSVTLATPASAIVAGLGYQCQLQSLYLDVEGGPTVQGKRKNIYGVSMRLSESRGVKAGSNKPNQSTREKQEPQAWPTMTLAKDLNTLTSNSPLAGNSVDLFTGDIRTNVIPGWRKAGQIAIQQDYPLPCTVTAIMPEFEVGDSDN